MLELKPSPVNDGSFLVKLPNGTWLRSIGKTTKTFFMSTDKLLCACLKEHYYIERPGYGNCIEQFQAGDIAAFLYRENWFWGVVKGGTGGLLTFRVLDPSWKGAEIYNFRAKSLLSDSIRKLFKMTQDEWSVFYKARALDE